MSATDETLHLFLKRCPYSAYETSNHSLLISFLKPRKAADFGEFAFFYFRGGFVQIQYIRFPNCSDDCGKTAFSVVQKK